MVNRKVGGFDTSKMRVEYFGQYPTKAAAESGAVTARNKYPDPKVKLAVVKRGYAVVVAKPVKKKRARIS